MGEDHCPLSKRVDGPRHSWRFDGDDPYIQCVYCGEVRDAHSGRVMRGPPMGEDRLIEALRKLRYRCLCVIHGGEALPLQEGTVAAWLRDPRNLSLILSEHSVEDVVKAKGGDSPGVVRNGEYLPFDDQVIEGPTPLYRFPDTQETNTNG